MIIDQVITDTYTAAHGDCVEFLRGLPDQSIGYAYFLRRSPRCTPTATHPRHGQRPRRCRVLRSLRFSHRRAAPGDEAGRNVSFHCMDMPSSKERDGVIGLKDFPGDLLRAFQRRGFIFHAKATIWKDPVTAMQRKGAGPAAQRACAKTRPCAAWESPTTSSRCAHLAKASRVTHGAEFPVDPWQKVASPVWMDINPSDTLQYMSAREHDDEKHICPLQLGVIRRGVMLWTNPGDIVLSPFMGIGSEGYVALEMGRRFIGVELKRSYFAQAKANLARAVAQTSDLFSEE